MTDIRLIERLEWESEQSFHEFNIEWNKTDINRDYQPEKGRSSNENGRQMRRVLDELSNKHKDGNILVVSHGGSLADLLRNIFGQENLPHEINAKTGAKYMKIQECSVTVIRKQKENYKLVKINDISHLL
jgi:broad specificity phosphatase PhoE